MTPAEIERSAQVIVHLTDDQASREAALLGIPGLPTAVGSTHELAEVVAGYAAIGLDELMVPDRALGASLSERLDTMDRLREDVFLRAVTS